jgi:NAD(P)H dehydrogenase (quinone)
MYVHVKVAVIYHSVTEQVGRLALAATDGAWDAGGEVRVRRLGQLAPLGEMHVRPECVEVLRETERMPEASPADLEWADVALFGTATPYSATLDSLTQFIDATVPLWRAGKLADKVYGAFTTAATVHGGSDGRLVSLADVFHHWGGIVVPLRPCDPISRQIGQPDVAARDARLVIRGAPGVSAAELAAARSQGRRATETARALKAGRRLLADVA